MKKIWCIQLSTVSEYCYRNLTALISFFLCVLDFWLFCAAVNIGKELLFAHRRKTHLWYTMTCHRKVTTHWQRETATHECVVSRRLKMTTYWQCSVWNQQRTCAASVMQNTSSEFRCGHHQHNHLLLSVSKSQSHYYTALKCWLCKTSFSPLLKLLCGSTVDQQHQTPC